MGAAKHFLDMAADFLMFVAACAFLIGGFSNTALIQRALDNSLMDKGTSVVADTYPEVSVSAEEVVAFLLLPDGIASVNINGTEYSNNIKNSTDAIDMDKAYRIIRESTDEGMKLRISSFEVPEGGNE